MAMHRYKSLISHPFNNPSNHFAFALLFSTSSVTKKQPINPSVVSEYLVEKHQFLPTVASKVASALTHLKTTEKCDIILSFLKENGYSKTQLETLVTKYPQVLCASLEHTIKPKMKVFQDLGFSASDTAEIISFNSWMFTHSADNRIMPVISVLKNVLGSITNVAKLLKVSGWFFKYDLEKTLLVNLEHMKNCGIDESQLTQHIYHFPRFFLNKPENVEKFIKKVDEMGYDKKSKLYIYAITAVSSMNDKNWDHKLEVFRSLGFSKDEMFLMFKKRPQVFAVSEKKLREIVKVVLSRGKYDMSIFVKHPGLLLCSIEDRLIPRLQVMEVLEKKKLLKTRPSVYVLYSISDTMFINRYITRNLKELGGTYYSKLLLN